MEVKTFEDVRQESILMIKEWISELEVKLKYTKQTVKRNALNKEILFWKAQIDDNRKELTDKFMKRYPRWLLKK